MSNMNLIRWVLAAALVLLSPATSFASTIVHCNLDCGVYGPNGFTLTPASGFNPYIPQTQTALTNYNASYATPQVFDLPINTTLISFTLTPLEGALGSQFSLWANEINPNNRLFGSNLQGAEFFGIVSDTPLQRIWVTTPDSGRPFAISEFMVGPTQANTTETPEPGTLATLGLGLMGVGLANRRKGMDRLLHGVHLLNFRLRRKLASFRKPKREHTEAMRRVLDAMDGRERLVLLRYYVDNKTVEEIAAEFNVTPEWIRAVKAEARSRFGAAIKTPCQGSLGDLVNAA